MAKTNHFGALATAAGALVAVGLLVLMMLVLVEPRPAEATFPGINGKIAYTGFDGNDSEIFTINPLDPGGVNRVQVTDNTTQDFRPDYSPNGKRIAYSGYGGQDLDIYTIKVDGTGLVAVTDNSSYPDLTPSYHPAGRTIAYSSKVTIFQSRNDYEIFAIDAAGGARFRVTHSTAGPYATRAFDPDWSPRGELILFESFNEEAHPDNYDIHGTPPDGKSRPPYVSSLATEHDPSYHPSGKLFAYTAWDGEDFELFTHKFGLLGGEDTLQITDNRTDDVRPDYSPNGKRIAFEGFDRNDNEIYTVNVDGTGLDQVTDNSTDDGDPSWGARRSPTLQRLPVNVPEPPGLGSPSK